MLSMSEALRTVSSCSLQARRPLGVEAVELLQACGRTLAEDLTAPQPLPPFKASLMVVDVDLHQRLLTRHWLQDGYAVVASAGAGVFRVSGRCSAGGDASSVMVTPDTLAYVATGAPLPQGADAVVKVCLQTFLRDASS